MKILALNCGSSSVKYMLYDWKNKTTISKGIAERVGLEDSYLKHTGNDEKSHTINKNIKNHSEAIELVIKTLTDPDIGVVANISEVSAVGHRVVHGGDRFVKSVKIDHEVIKTIEELSEIAPLHNPPNLMGINATMKLLPKTPQVAIFDTAFHQTMPDYAYMYAIPRNWYTDHKVRRYGFHGTSHLYVSKRAAVLLKKDPSTINLITLHIGNGVSHTAIQKGLSVDTSMGFTPLEGAIMGTRSGDLDPAIPLYMQEKLDISAPEMDSYLNKKSGLLGITKKYTDRRDIEENELTDPLCKLAIEMETYRVRKYIGSYMAVLGKVDAIVFTAGVGENSPIIREKALAGLENIGIILDKEKNKKTKSKSGETLISTTESPVKVFMIPTDEEIVFVEDVVGVLEGTYSDHMTYPYTFLK